MPKGGYCEETERAQMSMEWWNGLRDRGPSKYSQTYIKGTFEDVLALESVRLRIERTRQFQRHEAMRSRTFYKRTLVTAQKPPLKTSSFAMDPERCGSRPERLDVTGVDGVIEVVAFREVEWWRASAFARGDF